MSRIRSRIERLERTQPPASQTDGPPQLDWDAIAGNCEVAPGPPVFDPDDPLCEWWRALFAEWEREAKEGCPIEARLRKEEAKTIKDNGAWKESKEGVFRDA